MKLMNCVRISAFAGIFLALLSVLVFPCSAQLIESPIPMSFPVITNRLGWLGGEFRNSFKRVSEAQAIAKVERFRQSATPVTVHEFLGEKVVGFQVTNYDGPWFDGVDAANTLVQRSLRRVIFSPGKTDNHEPLLEDPRCPDMGGRAEVQAVLKYRTGREGIFQWAGGLLLVQDSDGTYWWTIWRGRSYLEIVRRDLSRINQVWRGRLGEGYRNWFEEVSEGEAFAKVERFRQSATPVTLQEFLGKKVVSFRVTYYNIPWFDSADAANTRVQRLLRGVIISPGTADDGLPMLKCPMFKCSDEPNMVAFKLQAVLKYQDGREGVFQYDGRYIFVQDSDGTYWWCRPPPQPSPETKRLDLSRTNRSTNASQTIRPKTNWKPRSADSLR